MHRRFHARHLIAALGLALFWGGLFACGDDPVDDDGHACTIGHPIEGASCECNGGDCICPSSGDCAILCIAACDLQCAGSGNCDFDCGPACDASCTGSGNCDVTVGAGSTVACTGSGDCDVVCEGDCVVRCPGSGTCTVFCEPGAECAIESCGMGSLEDCGAGVQVCNGGCPG